jgi:hypothetical protein
MGTARPPSPESGVSSSRRDALSRELTVVGSLATSGIAELAVEKPAEEPSTGPEAVPELLGVFDPSSAGAGWLGGGTEVVVPLPASESLRRFGDRLLLADACAVEKPDAAGTALVSPVSTAPVPPAASGAVPGAVVVVVVAPVLVEVGPEGAALQSGASGVVPGAAVVVVASVLVVVASVLVELGPEGAAVQSGASGVVPGAAVVVVASVLVEVGSEGTGTPVLGSVAPGALASVSTESVSGATTAFVEVSGSGVGAAAALVEVPEGSGGARSSARAVLTKIDAQARAASSAAVQPTTCSHRWSASKATRFGTTGVPSRWRQSCFEPRIIAVDTCRANRMTIVIRNRNRSERQAKAQVEPYGCLGTDRSRSCSRA